VDGKKRREGGDLAAVARAFPGSVRVERDYGLFVGLYLNVEWERASRVVETADAVAIGTGNARVPNAWIDLITDDPAERAEWRIREFQKRL
jgi:hypothetical protein